MKTVRGCSMALAGALLATACARQAVLPDDARFGADPVLPAPRHALLPTIEIAPARGWAGDATPVTGAGFAVGKLACGLDHPRWLLVLPDGGVLVAETDAPVRPADGRGVRGWIMKQVMRRAGSGLPSADRITLLRDADGDGRAETRSRYLEGLHSPFGMALVGDTLYVANADALLRFAWEPGATSLRGPGQQVAPLPGGPINHHWTRSLLASADGRHLYVGVGSNSNVAENGLAVERQRARILEIDPATGATRPYASGLRNPVGMDFNPADGTLWVVVNERDELGNDLVPDYLTRVREGAFYGWPWSYWGAHEDARVQPPRPDQVARALVPDYSLGAHTASLGLAFYDADAFPARYRGGAFVGQHGSWNRDPPSGYKVVFVPFAGGRPSGPPEDVLTGFRSADGHANGRPVGVAVAADDALLVADDVGGCGWRATHATDDRSLEAGQ